MRLNVLATHILVFRFILDSITAIGQNLVENPSFEFFDKCPEAPSNMTEDVNHWSVPTEGTTDYFNSCSHAMGVPKNFNGKQKSIFGKGYGGFYMLAPNDYREYLQGKLSETLIKGKKYVVSFYISLAEKSSYAINDIGVLLTKGKLHLPTNQTIKISRTRNKGNTYNYVQIKSKNFYVHKNKWMRVYKEIEATGDENYLIIGNFKNNAGTKIMKTGGKKRAAYYYIDMVSVSALNKVPPYDNLETEKSYVLENVLFATDEYVLNAIAKESLIELYNQLKENPSFLISVHAHTDTDGSNRYNRNLSSKRARAVADYLISLGLEENRIQWKGHGDEKPVADNLTAEGKKRNRRAEFIIHEARFGDKNPLTENLFEDN